MTTACEKLLWRAATRIYSRNLGFPASTTRAWLKRTARPVVTLEGPELDRQAHLARLEKQILILGQVVRLLLAARRVTGGGFSSERIPEHSKKAALLLSIDRARAHMSLTQALRIVGLPAGRFHSWRRREQTCSLDDRPSCARARPGRLTFSEMQKMGALVQSTAHRHMSIRSLALHAQRIGEVFAHPVTWTRLIRERGWRRPRLRIYPPKPKVGIRTSVPNEMWHIDASVLRLVDGSRVYTHAVIDNFSRRILGRRVEARLNPLNTFEVLTEAAEGLDGRTEAQVLMDSGVENLNRTVDPLFEGGQLKRVLAQVDVTFSNSMIEAWWRSLKHQWLYLHQLDSIATVRRLVAFYVQQHNELMPHSAFGGQTPDEVYFSRTGGIVEQLPSQRKLARQERLGTNQEVSCPECTRASPWLTEATAT